MRVLLCILLGLLPLVSLAATPAPPEPPGSSNHAVELLGLSGAEDYAAWMKRGNWTDIRPFSDSTTRFQLREGTLRMESRDEAFIIASDLSHHLSKSVAEYPYLRFVVKIGDVPRGAQLEGEKADDSAFRLYAVFNRDPWQALAYVWSWRMPVGTWSTRGYSFWGDFRGIRRKAFGQGEPLLEQWLTVEVDLRRDFQTQWPGQPLPVLRGLALKTDSNNVDGQRSLVWLRSASLHRTSLKAEGYESWSPYQGTTLWFR